ncbi:hypothetical protein [Caryophanon latum]|uniref:Uncharacterized protein n=1 Tax=Caryophanon latum TaxID=33977 RepID=A0A1C0YZ53_9BACL|nr:hypothetical protein [Caryophanon latum]OCS92488.1 hypothetical protein A6K76_06275 [Caryophanon latum]
MKISLYAAQKAIADDFIDFVGSEFSFEYEWKPLNEESKVGTVPHFSLFLLSLQSANSLWLKERVKQLLELGAHDQSIYFILMNKETVSKKSDIELVITDLSNQLSNYLVNPQIDVISLKVFKAFNEKEERFMYYDFALEEYRTIKQIVVGDADDFQDFLNYHGQGQVLNRLQIWSKSPYLLFWKNDEVSTVVTYSVPNIITDKLQQLARIQVIETKTLDEFNMLKQDQQVISLRYVAEDEINEQLASNEFLFGKSKTNPQIQYFDEEVYTLKKLPKDKLAQMVDLVFLDSKGYPKPKNKIQNWGAELENISGFTQLINEVKAKLV